MMVSPPEQIVGWKEKLTKISAAEILSKPSRRLLSNNEFFNDRGRSVMKSPGSWTLGATTTIVIVATFLGSLIGEAGNMFFKSLVFDRWRHFLL